MKWRWSLFKFSNSIKLSFWLQCVSVTHWGNDRQRRRQKKTEKKGRKSVTQTQVLSHSDPSGRGHIIQSLRLTDPLCRSTRWRAGCQGLLNGLDRDFLQPAWWSWHFSTSVPSLWGHFNAKRQSASEDLALAKERPHLNLSDVSQTIAG